MNATLAQPQTATEPHGDVFAATHSLPSVFGQQDARLGALCLPELFFSNAADKLEYVRGFELVAGETLLSRQVKQLMGGA